jgi:hypothetical protein
MDLRTVGLEEEFLLVDSTSGRARAIATAVLDLDDAEPPDEMEAELQSQQIETGTRPCTSTDELLEQVRSLDSGHRMPPVRWGPRSPRSAPPPCRSRQR